MSSASLLTYFLLIRGKLSLTKSAFVRSEILTPFVKTLTTDDKYSRRNMLNFTQQFEPPLSQKQKTFSRIFIPFLKSALNLDHVGKKDEYHSLVISSIIYSERGGYLNL